MMKSSAGSPTAPCAPSCAQRRTVPAPCPPAWPRQLYCGRASPWNAPSPGLSCLEDHEEDMMREFRCRDIGVDCDFVAQGNSDDEVLRACREHGQKAHGMPTLPAELEKKVRM